jgi:hypothetical protein
MFVFRGGEGLWLRASFLPEQIEHDDFRDILVKSVGASVHPCHLLTTAPA